MHEQFLARRQVQQEIREKLIACSTLSEADIHRLDKIAHDMPFIADINRSDLLLYARVDRQEALLVAHNSPHSTVPIHLADTPGRRVTPEDEGPLFKAMQYRIRTKGNKRMIDGGAPVIQEVLPVRSHDGRVIGGLSIEASLIAYVRQKARSKIFQKTAHALQAMLLMELLTNIDRLSPFTVNDGILVVDSEHMIRYASGIATEQYRNLGYLDNLVGRDLFSLDTGDKEMYTQAFHDLEGFEQVFEEHQRVLVRKAIPLITWPWQRPWYKPWQGFKCTPVGVLLAIHDATEEKKKERELNIKSAMIREIHHRVKNNLQAIAALLRMQVRRSSNSEVRQILTDSLNRIMSMAVVHEYLSRQEGQAINIREVTKRIVQQIEQSVMVPGKQINIRLEEGNNLYLPARQATACALVINELLQNSLEHGYEERNIGTISIDLGDEGEYVCIIISDDGAGLPSGFNLEQSTSMGLKIVQTLVQDDLGGIIAFENRNGVQATVRFSKKILEGEENWNV